jgi:hypothetical protein
MSEIIYLSNVRLSFPHLIEPQKNTNEQTGAVRVSYNAEFIMPKDHKSLQDFLQRYSEMALEKWKDHAQNVMNMIQQDRKLRCFGDGSEKVNKKTFKTYDGYEGHAYITAGRDSQPQIIQEDGSPIDPSNTMAYNQLTRKMYGGCRVNAAVKPWLQDNKHGRGVRCELIAVQFAGDDEAFGAGVADASGMFGATDTTEQPVQAAPNMGLPPFMQ